MIKQKLSEVEDFLKLKSIAIVGASTKPDHISRMLMKSLMDHDITVYPVHLSAENIDGMQCYPNVAEIDPKPDAVLVTLAKEKFRRVVDECIATGIKNVWLYGVIGPKSIDEDLQDYCLENGINLVAGYCPFMFLEKTEKFHKFHGLIWKLIGLYPKKN